jgi:hypothetical protein
MLFVCYSDFVIVLGAAKKLEAWLYESLKSYITILSHLTNNMQHPLYFKKKNGDLNKNNHYLTKMFLIGFMGQLISEEYFIPVVS